VKVPDPRFGTEAPLTKSLFFGNQRNYLETCAVKKKGREKWRLGRLRTYHELLRVAI
jgi:hypothetical protein